MFIALLFYGRLHKYKEHYNNIMNMVGTNNTIHSYLSSDNSDNNDLKGFIELYKPKSYINDEIDISKFDMLKSFEKNKGTNVNNMIKHFINKKRVFKLLEKEIDKSKIHYDVIISLRLDLVFNSRTTQRNNRLINVNNRLMNINNSRNNIVIKKNIRIIERNTNIFENTTPNILYIPKGSDWHGINDQVAMGDFATMKKYNNIIDNILLLLSNNMSIVHPERLTIANIIYNKLVVERIYLEYRIDK